MNIDDRLEALAARHEALAQTVELMLAEQRERDARIDSLHTDMMLAIARLANTAEAHNGQLADQGERIDKLEDRQ